MVTHQSTSHRQLVRFSLEINQSGPHLLKHRPGVLNGGPDSLSRLVATDISIDGLRDRTAVTEAPHPNIWDDCRFISESSILLDTAWRPTQREPHGCESNGDSPPKPKKQENGVRPEVDCLARGSMLRPDVRLGLQLAGTKYLDGQRL
jgi:hypothetical protein